MSDEMIERQEVGAEPAGEGIPAAAEAGSSGGGASAPSVVTDDGAPGGAAGDKAPAAAPDAAVVSGTQEPAPYESAVPPSEPAELPAIGQLKEAESEQGVPPAGAAETAPEPAAGEQTVTPDAEVRALREVYPDFDVEREMQDRTFRELVNGTVRPTLRQVYELCHRESLEAQAVSQAVNRAEQELIAHIRARGQRPQENGTSDTGAVQAHPNVDRLTRSERAALARRAEQGEHVRL